MKKKLGVLVLVVATGVLSVAGNAHAMVEPEEVVCTTSETVVKHANTVLAKFASDIGVQLSAYLEKK